MGIMVVYGFGAFGQVRSNPSGLLMERLWETPLKNGAMFRTLPVSYVQAARDLRGIFSEHEVDCVVGFGLARGEHAVRLEAQALNVVDTSRKDANGTPPPSAEVVAGGPKSYATAYDVELLSAHLNGEGVPARVSQDAGSFMCNYAYYLSAHLLAESAGRGGKKGGRRRRPEVLCVHLPLHPAEAARLGSKDPSMGLEMMEHAAMAVLERGRGY